MTSSLGKLRHGIGRGGGESVRINMENKRI